MATTITAGNATNGAAISSDNTGILELKTGTGAGTTALTLNTGQQAAYALGTAAAPSITFSGDTNTGIFSPTADTIAFTEGGVESMRLNSSGNLGLGTGSSINVSGMEISRATGVSPTPVELRLTTTTNDSGWSTTNPWARLSFYSADASVGGAKVHASIQTTAQSSAGGNSNLDFFVTDTANGTLFRTLSFQGAGTNTTQTLFYSGGGAQAMTLAATGNLGVGTTDNDVNSGNGAGVTTKISTNSGCGYAATNINTGVGAYSVYQLGNNNTVNRAGLALTGSGWTTSGMTRQDGVYLYTPGAGGITINVESGQPIYFGTSNTERARITSGGFLLVGVNTSVGYGSVHRICNVAAQGTAVLSIDGGVEYAMYAQAVNGANYNVADTAQRIGRNTSTGRSINAGGTINASGADYAEYMVKSGDFTIAKGDICGVDADGKLTNVFADAISFVVKSTDPSYVGGDTWGTQEALGQKYPKQPAGDATDEEKAQYELDKAAYDAALEEARQIVDRIAFAGQVPVNVLGATAGQYIIPVDDNGAIKGEAVSNPTFEQYQIAVGKVIATDPDGRAKIIVKVV